MKKILVYINSMSPAGGIERVVANLFNELSKDFEVILLTKDNKKSFYKLNENIQVETLDNYLELDLKKSKFSRMYSIFKNIFSGNLKLKKKIKEIKPDFIYTVSPLDSLEIIISKSKNVKLIISEHGSKQGYNKIYDNLKKIIYPKAYKLIVPSKMDTELYLKEGYPAEYIPHLTTFLSDSKSKLSSKIVLNIGRYTDDKRQDLLIEMWNILYKKGEIKDWKLHIVGKGENKEKLQKKIDDYKLSEVIKLLPPKEKVEEYFREASIFAFTSRFEGFGMVLLEAMSFGLPCIAFDCPSGPRDVVSDGVNGYLIENGNRAEFEEKLLKLIQNKDLREKMSEKAHKTISTWNNKEILKKWKIFLS